MHTLSFVQAIGNLQASKIQLCDIGARGGLQGPWVDFQDLLTVYLFEPDPAEYVRLAVGKSPGRNYFNCALSETNGTRELKITRSPGCSSLLEPNFDLLGRYPESERFEIEKIVKVETETLDRLFDEQKGDGVDFIKIDTQGTELDILRGGRRVIESQVLGLEVEIAFQELYRGQPMFGEVDAYIRNTFGFELFDIRKTYWKRAVGIGAGGLKGQAVFGDALYFRPPEAVLACCAEWGKRRAVEKILSACLGYVAYGYVDNALSLLARPETRRRLGPEKSEKTARLVRSFGKSRNYSFRGASALAGIFHYFYSMTRPSHGKWASADRRLGTSKRFSVFS